MSKVDWERPREATFTLMLTEAEARQLLDVLGPLPAAGVAYPLFRDLSAALKAAGIVY